MNRIAFTRKVQENFAEENAKEFIRVGHITDAHGKQTKRAEK